MADEARDLTEEQLDVIRDALKSRFEGDFVCPGSHKEQKGWHIASRLTKLAATDGTHMVSTAIFCGSCGYTMSFVLGHLGLSEEDVKNARKGVEAVGRI